MPLIAFQRGDTLEEVPLDKAVQVFEEAGLLPAEVSSLIIQEEQHQSERGRDFVSPSIVDPRTTCRREVLIQRFLPYVLDPKRRWMAKEGQFWHTAFQQGGAGPDWLHEVWLPADKRVKEWRPEWGNNDEAHPKTKRFEDGKLRLEVWPGIWMRGRLDRIRKDWKVLVDHKTTRMTRRDYGLKDDWRLRLSIYSRMIEMLRGEAPERLAVWRMYRGSYELDKTFRLFDEVEPIDLEEAGCEEFARSLVGLLKDASKCENEAELRELVGTVSMDGESMFGGKKCSSYCDVKEPCYKIAGRVTF